MKIRTDAGSAESGKTGCIRGRGMGKKRRIIISPMDRSDGGITQDRQAERERVNDRRGMGNKKSCVRKSEKGINRTGRTKIKKIVTKSRLNESYTGGGKRKSQDNWSGRRTPRGQAPSGPRRGFKKNGHKTREKEGHESGERGGSLMALEPDGEEEGEGFLKNTVSLVEQFGEDDCENWGNDMRKAKKSRKDTVSENLAECNGKKKPEASQRPRLNGVLAISRTPKGNQSYKTRADQ